MDQHHTPQAADALRRALWRGRVAHAALCAVALCGLIGAARGGESVGVTSSVAPVAGWSSEPADWAASRVTMNEGSSPQTSVRLIRALQAPVHTQAWGAAPVDMRWYGYVRLDPVLPVRMQQWLGRPESALTFDLRSANAWSGAQLGVGSIMRWQAGEGQIGLRLRGGRLGLQYGRALTF